MKINSSNKGFSLAELIGVVTILGILAAAVIGFITTLGPEARAKTAKYSAAEINSKIATVNSVGTTLPAWGTAMNGSSAVAVVTLLQNGVLLQDSTMVVTVSPGIDPAAFTTWTFDNTKKIVVPPN